MQTKEQQAETYISVELEMVPYITIDLKKSELEKILSIICMLDVRRHFGTQDNIGFENMYWYLRQFRDEAMDDHCIVKLRQGYAATLWVFLWDYRSHYHAEQWIWELSQKIQDTLGQIKTSQNKI